MRPGKEVVGGVVGCNETTQFDFISCISLVCEGGYCVLCKQSEPRIVRILEMN